MAALKETLLFLWLSSLHKLRRTSVLGAISAGLALYGDVVSPARDAVLRWTVLALLLAAASIAILVWVARRHRPLVEATAGGRRVLADRADVTSLAVTREVSLFAILALLMLGLTLTGQRTLAKPSASEGSGSLFATLLPALNGLRADMTEVKAELKQVKRETSEDPRKELANLGVAWNGDNFLEAVRTGDTRLISLFLQGEMPLYSASSQGRPLPVMLALNDSNARAVLDQLLRGGLDIDHYYEMPGGLGPVRTTLLGRALEKGNDDLALALLAKGADLAAPIQTFGTMGMTKDTFPLASAVQWQRWPVVAAMLEAHADISLGDYLAYREAVAVLPRVRAPAEREQLTALLPQLQPAGADGERLAAQMRLQEVNAELNKVALEGIREMRGSSRKLALDARYDELQKERAALMATTGQQ